MKILKLMEGAFLKKNRGEEPLSDNNLFTGSKEADISSIALEDRKNYRELIKFKWGLIFAGLCILVAALTAVFGNNGSGLYTALFSVSSSIIGYIFSEYKSY